MKSNKRIYHIITSLGIGGAQKTLRYFINSKLNIAVNEVVELRDKKGSFNLVRNFTSIFQIPNHADSVVCCWMYHSILVGLLLKLFKRNIRLVLMIRNGLDSPRSLKRMTMIVVWISARLSSLANKSIYCSESSMKSHINFGYDSSKAIYLYNGVDLHFSNSSKKSFKDGITFSTVARYEPQKGFNILLDALNQVDNMNLPASIDYLIFGENVSRLTIPGFRQINVSVFDPCVNKNSVSEILERSHCHILPSLSEGFANINLEALSKGNFIICSDTGDSYIFPKNFCATFPIADSKRLAALIFAYVESPDKKNDFENIEHFLRESFPLSNFDELVRSVLIA